MNNRSYLLMFTMCQVPFSELYTYPMNSSPKPRASLYYYAILQMRELRHTESTYLAQDHIARRSRVKHSGPQSRQSDSQDLVLCQHVICLPGDFVRVSLRACFSFEVAARLLEVNVTFLSYGVYDERGSTFNSVPFLEKQQRNEVTALAALYYRSVIRP